MKNPNFNKTEAFKKQKELVKKKRDRLDGLIKLLDKLEKGESDMNLNKSDLSEYLQILEQFKSENSEDVIKYWGSIETFEQFISKVKKDESHVAELAIKQYGSIEKYTAAMKDSISHFSENMQKFDNLKENGYVEKNKVLMEQLVKDITRDVKSKEVQNIVNELVTLTKEINIDMGDNYWNMITDGYLHNDIMIKTSDKLYGSGASQFIGKALEYYFQH